MIQLFISQFAATTVEEASGISALGIDPLAIVAQGATFVALFFILKKFAFGKIAAVLQKRRDEIEKSIVRAEKISKQESELERRIESMMFTARGQATELLQKTKAEAAELIADAEAAARSRADDIIRDNHARIAREVDTARQELRAELAGLVADTTSAILRDSMTQAQERKLIETYLREVL